MTSDTQRSECPCCHNSGDPCYHCDMRPEPESTPPKVGSEELDAAGLEAAYDAFTRSFGSRPIGSNNTRDDLRSAIRAYLALASPVDHPEVVGELQQINEMLDEGQGDDEGPQGMPDSEPSMSVLAKVERCLFLLEKRRDVIAAYGDERLFDDSAPMADGEIKMTAAEDVLAWLLIEKIGVPDDEPITPKRAQETIANVIDNLRQYELAALQPSDSPALEAGVAVTDAMISRACAAFDDGVGDPSNGKRRMEKALRAALSIPAKEPK